MPWSTLEVRWFLPGPLAESGSGVEGWFRSHPVFGAAPVAWTPAPPAWRQDRYLLMPSHGDMGIKWREGRLEIKGREAALGHQLFAPGIEGWSERWLKWSYAGEAVERRLFGLCRDGAADGVVTIEKQRLQRTLPVAAVTGAAASRPNDSRERGVNVELAQIRVAGWPGETHWSLAFEAFPSDPAMVERFAPVVACFLGSCPALPLGAERSMSYPRWLLRFDRP